MSTDICPLCGKPITPKQEMIRDKELGPCHPKCRTGKPGFALTAEEAAEITGVPFDGREEEEE